MTNATRTRPMLGALLAALVASSILSPGCGGNPGPDRAPTTATEEVYQGREKAIMDRYAKTKPQGPASKRK